MTLTQIKQIVLNDVIKKQTASNKGGENTNNLMEKIVANKCKNDKAEVIATRPMKKNQNNPRKW